MKNLYQCDRCGFQSEDYEEVRECENSHAHYYKGMNMEESNATFTQGSILPDTIEIHFNNWNTEGEIIGKYKKVGQVVADVLGYPELKK